MKLLHYPQNAQEVCNVNYKTSNGKLMYTINHDFSRVIETIFIGDTLAGRHNSQGWERNSVKHFKELLNSHPEFFDTENTISIKNNRPPTVNKKFINSFPQFKDYMGEKLIMHHIGGDGQVVAIPESMHRGSGEIHNIERDLGIRDLAEKFSSQVKNEIQKGTLEPGQIVGHYVEKIRNPESSYQLKSDDNSCNIEIKKKQSVHDYELY